LRFVSLAIVAGGPRWRCNPRRVPLTPWGVRFRAAPTGPDRDSTHNTSTGGTQEPTVTIPAQLVPYVRSGLYEYLQGTYEALDVIILTPGRENPQHASQQQRLLDEFQAAAAALPAARDTGEPSGPVTISLLEHRAALLKAVRAAARTEQCLTEELPAESPRRQQARQTITALRQLARQIKAQDTSTEDLYLQRLVLLAALNAPEGATRIELRQALEDYPPEDVDDATTHLAAAGLLRVVSEHVHPADGLLLIEELDLIGL
jgi:hypothetical protein